jgi:hypothetical protein
MLAAPLARATREVQAGEGGWWWWWSEWTPSPLRALAVANKETLVAFLGLWAGHVGAAALARWHATADAARSASARPWPPPPTLASAAAHRSARSAVAAACLAAAAAALSLLDPPCRRTASPSWVVACLSLHEAGSAAVAAVLALAACTAGPATTTVGGAPLLTAALGGPGALAALLAANVSSGALNLHGLTDGAGPGRARVLLGCHLAFTLAAGAAAARWRSSRRMVKGGRGARS